MKERPILFSGPMVKAILNGNKTQTRRPVTRLRCPYGTIGDRLWVRETFALEQQVERDQKPPFSDGRPTLWVRPHYRATDPTPQLRYEETDGEPCVRWKSSIFMPRWASRIVLEIVDIRVQRLQEITESDALAEGISFSENGFFIGDSPDVEPTAVCAYSYLWDSLYAEKGYGWLLNPSVWVIDFKKCTNGSFSILEMVR